jgi:hypothetical protein
MLEPKNPWQHACWGNFGFDIRFTRCRLVANVKSLAFAGFGRITRGFERGMVNFMEIAADILR